MEIPLIPDLSNPKWLIIGEILKTVGSKRSKKIASRLKIPDVQFFIDCMKILILADTFELDYSYVVSEINSNKKLKSFMELGTIPEIENIYKNKFISKLENKSMASFSEAYSKNQPTPIKKDEDM